MLVKILNLIGKKHGAQKELANFLGISSNNITDWKSGRNKSYRLYLPQIAEYYSVSLDWLSGLTNEKEKPAINENDELSALQSEIMDNIKLLSTDRQEMILAQIKGLLQSKK